MKKAEIKNVKPLLQQHNVMCCGVWEEFTGQILNTTDLLFTKHGLAFVDSGYTDKSPSRISSIPEDWSFSFENGGINQRSKNGDADEYILPNGKYYYTNVLGKKRIGGQILFVCRVSKP